MYTYDLLPHLDITCDDYPVQFVGFVRNTSNRSEKGLTLVQYCIPIPFDNGYHKELMDTMLS